MQHHKLTSGRSFIYIFSLVLLLAACRQPGQPAPDPISDQTTLTFACFSWLLDDYEQLAEEFQAANPDVVVQLVTVQELEDLQADTPIQEALRQVASGADAFTYFIPTPGVEQGLVRDLTPLIEADPTFEPDDYYPGVLAIYRWHEGIWGLPAGLNFRLIHYDKAAFDAAGVAYPQVGWPYQEFVNKARQLTLSRDGEVVQYGFVDSWSRGLPSFVHGRAGALVASGDATWPPRPALDRPAVAEAVAWYADLALRHEVMPNAGQTDENLIASLQRDQAAMWVDTLVSFQQQGQQDRVGVMTFPTGAHPTNALSVWGYFVSAGTAHPQAAWRWLAFLSRQEVVSTGIPPRRSVAATGGFWEGLDEERAAVYRHALENAFVPPGPEVQAALTEAARAALTGEQAAEDVLAEAQATLVGSPAAAEAPATPVVGITPTPPAGEVTILEFVPPPLQTAPYEPLADAFQDAHPGIHVHVRDYLPPSGTHFGLETLAKQGDCFASGGVLPILAGHQYILNLQPLLEADPAFPLDDFYPHVLAAGRWGGDLWALPQAITLPVIRYNKDLFDAAGVAYPRPGWTWDDFLEKAVALTDGQGADKQYGFAMNIGQISQFARQQAGPLLDLDADPPRPRLDDPAVVEATRRLAGLVRVYGVMESISYPKNFREFNDEFLRRGKMRDAGKVAMWAKLSSTQYLGGAARLRIGTAPLPLGEGSVDLGGDFLYISADTEHPQACWEWLKFLTGQQYLMEGTIPARRSLAESDGFQKRVGEEEAAALLFAIEHSTNASLQISNAYPELARVYYWFYRAYEEIVNGTEAEQALKEAQGKAEAYVFCLEDRQGFNERQVALACAREADPDYRGLLGD